MTRLTIGWAALGALAALTTCVQGSNRVVPPTDTKEPADLVANDHAATDDAPTPDSGADTSDVPAPKPFSVLAVTPNRGLTTGLEQVEIVGQGFGAGMSIYFGEALAEDVFVLDAERAAVLTPPHPPGWVDIRAVEPGDGRSAELADAFLYHDPLAITSVEPAEGRVLGGDEIVVTGAGFLPATVLLIDGRAAHSVTYSDPSTLVALTPDALEPGLVDVHVATDAGFAVLKDGFWYRAPPAIDRVIPPAGPLVGGTTVEIHGAGFESWLSVTFGSKQASAWTALPDSGLYTVAPPASQQGPVDVVVSTTYGSAVAVDGYTYLADPSPGDVLQILAVTPAEGPEAGGNSVTLVAKGLTTAADTSVLFGDLSASLAVVDPMGYEVRVTAPPGAPGVVDVTLANANGSQTLAAAYTYLPALRIYEVVPNFGPAEGGTAVTVFGAGFDAGAELRFGIQPAEDALVVDGGTITATTPPGSPGLANVRVLQEDRVALLPSGFVYQGSLELWAVSPAQGAIAGGTQLQLLGSGFVSDARVFLGDQEAMKVEVVSPNLITAYTPPADIGYVDVRVATTTKGEVTRVSGYRYYDPRKDHYWTWGEPIDGHVYLTVLSLYDGLPIADVFAMLGDDPATPHQKYTNQNGQVTFSGPDLVGEQLVTAASGAHYATSLAGFDATNVTLYLTPHVVEVSPPPSVMAPKLFGTVVGLEEAVAFPWGACADKPLAPGTVCDPCVDDGDCSGLQCTQLPDQGSHCTAQCGTDDDCPVGFLCGSPDDGLEQRCLPTRGRRAAFCDHTDRTPFSAERHWPAVEELGQAVDGPQPGLLVEPDGSFEMALPLGQMAVACWGGVIDPAMQTFTPEVLGLVRYVVAYEGDEFEVDIVLDHPLDAELSVRLDEPQIEPGGPDFSYLKAWLDLSGDGVLEYLDHPYSMDAGPLVMPRLPGSLEGALYDARHTFLAGTYSFTDDNLPNSLTLREGVQELVGDFAFERHADGWVAVPAGAYASVTALWGLGDDEQLAVGAGGTIARVVDGVWEIEQSGVTADLAAVHGAAGGPIIAVGADGAATHYDGASWTPQPTGFAYDLTGVWVASSDEAFAVGWYAVLHWADGAWSKLGGNTTKNLHDVWGFAPDDVWAVGHYGTIIRYDGTDWSDVLSGTMEHLWAVWGAGPNDVYMVGDGGLVLHWDGAELVPLEVGTTASLRAVWGRDADEVYAVGDRGTILRFDGQSWHEESPAGHESAFLAVGGDEARILTTGPYELWLGPMLPVPDALEPADGAELGDELRVAWSVPPEPPASFTRASLNVPGLFGPIPNWTVLADGDLQEVVLPDLSGELGLVAIPPGPVKLDVIRVYGPGLDIDELATKHLWTGAWTSWSRDSTLFTKL